MEQYEPCLQFVKPIQNIQVSTFISIDIQRQDRHSNAKCNIFKTATTLCPTAPQNGSTSANPHPCTHQTTPRTTPCPTAPPKRIHKICEPSPYTWSKNPPFRSCISSRFAGAIKYTGLRACSVCAVGDFLQSWSMIRVSVPWWVARPMNF